MWYNPGMDGLCDRSEIRKGMRVRRKVLSPEARAAAAEDAMRLGIAYAFQVVKAFPIEPHDIRLNGIVDAFCCRGH